MLTKNQEKAIIDLHAKKGRAEQHCFIIEGIKPLEELAGGTVSARFLVIDENRSCQPEIKSIIDRFNTLPCFSSRNFQRLSTMDTPEGILAVCVLPEPALPDEFTAEKKNLLAVYEINDPGNLGTIIRTARWFGIDGIILIGNCTDPYAPKTVRSSMGAVLKMPICRVSNLNEIAAYLQDFYKIGSFVHSPHSSKSNGKERKILFLGSEAHGLPAEYEAKLDANYLIPAKTAFESLNIAVAAGIMLHQIFGTD